MTNLNHIVPSSGVGQPRLIWSRNPKRKCHGTINFLIACQIVCQLSLYSANISTLQQQMVKKDCTKEETEKIQIMYLLDNKYLIHSTLMKYFIIN
jgi:hypothetical protein